MEKRYDYLLVGAGLFNAVFANQVTSQGKTCLVIEKRAHIGGNLYTEEIEGINVHKYGAHIFHTSNKETWEFINKFSVFNNYINSPIAIYNGELYNLPFNMNTFSKLWRIQTPSEAQKIINEQIVKANITTPKNLEEQAIGMVGTDIYEKLIKGYTEKQWGKRCKDLPASIIKRLPVRFTYDNNYFNDIYQGIPIGGYTKIIEKMLSSTKILLNTDYFEFVKENENVAQKTIFTGAIDQYFDYCFGELEYRSLRFEEEIIPISNFQGNAVVNYTGSTPLFTRIIEHKHFEKGTQKSTVITREYPIPFEKNCEPYYPINDTKNNELYEKYTDLAKKTNNIIFGGRLGCYKYFDMNHVVEMALKLVEEEVK